MKLAIQNAVFGGIVLLVMGWSSTALADYNITCESKGNRHNSCRLNQAGYVTLSRQLSGSSCRQGRDWDYDRREIWVDDGCRAEFKVHTYGNSGGSSSSSNTATAAGVIVGAALLGALISIS